MAGCFYVPKPNNHKKRRTKSLEELANSDNNQQQPQIQQPDSPDMTLLTNNKFPGKLGRLFRSKSEQILKSSPRSSPMNSPKQTQPRRRLLRVIRDDQQEGEEWENPHVIRRYSKGYWEEKQMEVSKLLQHSESQSYDVNTERTILKKSQTSSVSTDSENEAGNSSPTINKHACFKDEVQVIEFIGKEKITKQAHYMHEMRLVDVTTDEGGRSDDKSDENIEGIKKMLKEERINEFGKAKESLESVEESDEDELCKENVVNSDCYTNDSALSSDTMSEDTSSCYSDSDIPKKKQKKKRRHLRVKFFLSSSSSSGSGSSDSRDSGISAGKRKTDRRLLGLHAQEEVDVMDSEVARSNLTLIPEQ